MSRYSKHLKDLGLLIDLIILNISYVIANYLKFKGFPTPFLVMMLYINLSWLLLTTYFKTYSNNRMFRIYQILQSFYTILFFHILLVSAYYVVEQSNRYSRELLLYMYSILFISITIWKIAFINLIRKYRSKGYNYRNVIVVSNSDNPIQIKSILNNQPDYGYRVIDTFDTTRQSHAEINDEIMSLCERENINEIYYSLSGINQETLWELMNFAEEKFIKFHLIADFQSMMFRSLEVYHYANIPVLKVISTPLDERKNRIVKRTFDIVFSSFVILFWLSWFLPILILLIRLTSRGSAFFIQERTGKDNVSFNCYKLRTMYVNDQRDTLQASLDDDRITPIGHFLRNYSLDELPQFFNVLMGSMSVVGPRPHMISHTQAFSDELEQFMMRHKIKPGITGLAQTKGYRGETSEYEQRRNRVKMDLFYIKNWSLLFDIGIIFNTISDVFKHGKTQQRKQKIYLTNKYNRVKI